MSVDALLNPAQVEAQRLELKATWDKKIEEAVVATACAFANDLYNLNGGYIVLGVEEEAGRPVLPPRGIDELDLDRVQKDIFAACKAIKPDYQPILFVEAQAGRRLLVLACPGGDNRPYQAPNPRRGDQPGYFVRQGPLTVLATGDTLRQLLEQASKVPFDDRRCLGASILDISPTLVRRHLHHSGSHLAEAPLSDEELYRKLRLLVPVNAHAEPRNVALLFFNEEPTRFFPGARIELCEFPEGRGGDVLRERTFSGPLPEQIRACQSHLEGLLGSLTRKLEKGAEARRTLPYPSRALQEALVNAVYHRGYDSPEPTKVYIEPDCITVISYPGPHPRITAEHFRPGQQVPEVPARNRRIGELLKEVRLCEARGSGFLKIQAALAQNGSPPAEVDCDPTFFAVRVPIHAEYAWWSAEELWDSGHQQAALVTLQRAFSRQPDSWQLASAGINLALRSHDEKAARQILDKHLSEAGEQVHDWPILRWVSYCITGVPFFLWLFVLEPSTSIQPQRDLKSLLSRIKIFDNDFNRLIIAFFYWCLDEPGESHILLQEILLHGDEPAAFAPAALMLAGVRLALLTEYPEFADQLLFETEDLLEAAIHRPRLSLHPSSIGRLYLRLAQVRQRLQAPSREVNEAVRLARKYAKDAKDGELLEYLARAFPPVRSRRA